MTERERAIAVLRAEATSLRDRLRTLDQEIARLESAPASAPPIAPPTIQAQPRADRSPSAPPPPPSGLAPDRADAVERFVGTRLAAALGAFVTLIGVAVFVKFAIDEGWLGRLGPLARLAAGYAFALGLVGAGLFAERRLGRGGAIGLFAAGIGSLYAATAVGTIGMELLPPAAAVLAAAATAVLGVILTLRSGSLLVATVGLFGAYLTPAIGGAYLTDPGLVGLHLSVVLALALLLSWIRPQPFRFLRYAIIPLHACFAIPWVFSSAPPALIVITVSLWWAMVAMECILAAWAGRSPIGNVVATIMGSIAAATVSVPFIAEQVGPTEPLAYAPAMLAVFAALGGLLLRGPDPEDAIDAEEAAIARAMRLLSTALFVQAAALATLGAAPFLDTGGLVAAWAISAILCVEIGRRIAGVGSGLARGLAWWAAVLILGSIGAAFAAVVDSRIWGGPVAIWPQEFERVAAVVLEPALWAPALAVIASIDLVLRSGRAAPRGRGDAALAIIASLVCALACAHLVAWGARGFLVPALLVLPVAFLRPPRSSLAGGCAAAAIASLAWLVHLFDHAPPGLLSSMLWAALLAQFAIAVGWATLGRSASFRPLRVALVSIAVLWLAAGMAACAFVASDDGLSGGGAWRSGDVTVTVIALVGFALVAASGRVRGRISEDDARTVGRAAALVVMAAGLFWLMSGVVSLASDPLATQGGRWGRLLVGLLLIATLLVTRRELRGRGPVVGTGSRAILSALPIEALVLGIWLGSLVFAQAFADAGWRVVQPVLSAWWGVAAIALLVAGFRHRVGWLRWAGLGLLGLVGFKVLAMDLAAAAAGWRVVATLFVGLLLVGTSVAYVRVIRMAEGSKTARS